MASSHDGFQEELTALKGDIKKIHEDLAFLAEGLTHEGKKEWKEAKKAISATASRSISGLSDAAHEVAERSEAALKTVQSGISERPLTSLLAALGVGYLLGKLLGRD